MKRMIAAFLIIMMIVPLAASAADDISAPTVDEILGEYHQCAFAERRLNEYSSNVARDLDGQGNSALAEKTVDELNAAGYVAYHVTNNNYGAIEAELCTDFESMGLNSDSSYIVVIHGDEARQPSEKRTELLSISPETDFEGPPGIGHRGFNMSITGLRIQCDM